MRDAFLPRASVVLTQGGRLLSKVVRWASTTIGESPTEVSHMAGIYNEGYVYDYPRATIIESDIKIRYGSLAEHHQFDGIWVFDHVSMPKEVRWDVASKVMLQVGKLYGFLQLPAQLIDHKILFGKNIVRRIMKLSPLDICSRLWAEQYSNHGYHFGVAPYAATPDDVFDFCMAHPEHYNLIFHQKRRSRS